MAVKGGDIIHVANDVALIDRLQTAGPGTVNIRREMIYELGNYRSVGQVSDIPDLQFSMESFDVSCEMEAFLLDVDVNSTNFYDLSKSKLVNIKSAFKPGQNAANAFETVASASVPALRLEQMQYRFGVGNQNARQTASLRGDSLFYSPGTTYIQRVDGTATANQAIALDYEALEVVEGGVTRRTIAVTAGQQRLILGGDYTEDTVGTVTTVTILNPVPITDKISIVYASTEVESFPQSSHPDSTVKPAAIRGRDIEVFIGPAHPDGTDVAVARGTRRGGVQSVDVDWRVTLQNDEELGSYYYVNIDFDIPAVSGSVAFRPATPQAMVYLAQDLSGETDRTRSAQSTDAPLLDVQVALKNPADGTVLKRLHIPDARFSLPGYSGRVQQKLDLTGAFQSDQGLLYVYDS